jgi:hypothetical protein
MKIVMKLFPTKTIKQVNNKIIKIKNLLFSESILKKDAAQTIRRPRMHHPLDKVASVTVEEVLNDSLIEEVKE